MKLTAQKLEGWGTVWWKSHDPITSTVFAWITRVTDGRTDRQTDRQTDGRTVRRNSWARTRRASAGPRAYADRHTDTRQKTDTTYHQPTSQPKWQYPAESWEMHHFQAMTTYWLKIVEKTQPPSFGIWWPLANFSMNHISPETRVMGLSDGVHFTILLSLC